MTEPRAEQRSILWALVELKQPLEKVLRELSQVEWDSDEELVTVRPEHVSAVLERFKAGALDAESVERWANSVEGREDIGLEQSHRALLQAVIFELANPSLQGPLTLAVADRWIERLSERAKIRFPFTNTTGDDEIETMWALKRDDGYEIDNIPFYVKEIALGDVVAATPDADGALWYSELIRPSGHSTIRLLFSNVASVGAVRDELRRMGCSSELSDIPRLVAIDVPPSAPYEQVKAFLDRGEAEGRFEYQEACLGFL